MRARATVRFGLISAWVTNQQSLINEAKSSLLQSSERYRQAYQPYAAAVRAARREAQNQQQWMDIFIGIGIGVSVGLLAEALLPEAATLAAEAAAEVGAEVVEAGAGAAAHNLLPQIAGQNLEPGGLDPNVLELDVWRTLERLYHDLTSIVPFGNSLFLINGGAEYAIGEIRAHVAGGQTDMSEEQLLDLVQSLIRADRSGAAVEREVRSRLERLPDVLSRIRAAAAGLPSVEQMEKDIWVLWISEISESDSDILDLDAIEDHLAAIGVIGPNSVLGVDFGIWTSEDDQLDAIRAARRQAPEVRRRYGAVRGA